MKIYRAFINQPSKNQSLHKLHGKRGIAFEKSPKDITMYFSEGDLISIQVQKAFISPFN